MLLHHTGCKAWVIVAQGGPISGALIWSLAQLWSRQHAAGSVRAKILVVEEHGCRLTAMSGLIVLAGPGGGLAVARRKLTAAVQHAHMQPSITTHSCANAEPMQDGLKLQSCVVKVWRQLHI